MACTSCVLFPETYKLKDLGWLAHPLHNDPMELTENLKPSSSTGWLNSVLNFPEFLLFVLQGYAPVGRTSEGNEEASELSSMAVVREPASPQTGGFSTFTNPSASSSEKWDWKGHNFTRGSCNHVSTWELPRYSVAVCCGIMTYAEPLEQSICSRNVCPCPPPLSFFPECLFPS